MLEYFAPLVKYIEEDLLSMELITVKQGINLGLPAQANVVQHGHALFLHSLDQLFNLCVELSIVSPDLVKGLD